MGLVQSIRPIPYSFCNMVTLRDSNGSEVDIMLAILSLLYLIMEILPWWFLPMVPIAVLSAIIIALMPNWLFPQPQLSEYAGD